MKSIIEQFNPLFENRIRLAVMSILAVNDRMDFNTLKQTLDLTDGNLASHVAALEKNNYVSISKKFVGKKTLTTYAVTAAGKRAFTEHLDAIEQLISTSQKGKS
jgi:DNA-binding MarR family transcriptional regulator